MWTKKNLFLWIDIKDKGKHAIRFPIALVVIKALFETILEFFSVLSLFIPKMRIKSQDEKVIVTIKDFEIVLNVIDEMIAILEYEHQLELVDVRSKETNVTIVLK